MDLFCFGVLILICLEINHITGQQLDNTKRVWSECSLTCGGGTQFMLKNKTSTRLCNTMSCPGDAGCISTYQSFDHVTGKTIYDESNNGNLATMKGEAKIIDKGKFGKALKLSKNGSVSFDVIHFRNRPSLAITIALWLKLSEIKGAQEIFYTCGDTSRYNIGAYHITVDNGIVKWSRKNKDGDKIFSLAAGKPMKNSTWYHIAGTYRLSTGKARLFINGKISNETKTSKPQSTPKLNDNWKCADMGNPSAKKPVEGILDEFYIFKCELLPEEISELFSKNEFKKFKIPRPNSNPG
ncbi:uncharacterized protein LOC116305654 [Actinia tenebrosa]|uniref:Uncharacterized protein LOC116305654 n=1 Tax=Actinia tenebrosa TaxID=6105 RepID=A0A6P8IWN5_ACTTE|nr:uncharacterized protein LOC116305654 [Actinia tenebrosa]XP_031571482.1 uncharacterized protein LOC116305654 [Actinia tenebrosa]